jgi:Uma2 family endonuclease
MTTFSELSVEELFPESDGKPMADNTEQFRWIVLIKENLEILFATDPNVFVAGDLLWYPVKSTQIAPKAPDAMVVFGRPKGRRGAYRQWLEDNRPPQVVFEILSPGNTPAEMRQKLEFYDRYGVEEYYQYDPDEFELLGWQRNESCLVPIHPMNGWVSPRLGIRFEWTGEPLSLYHPNGEPFLSPVDLAASREQERSRAERAQERADLLAAKLRELGINPDEL